MPKFTFKIALAALTLVGAASLFAADKEPAARQRITGGDESLDADVFTVTGKNRLGVDATQAGTWNINNVSGTVSLPTGASTSANQSTQITSLQLLDDVPTANDATMSKGSPSMGMFDDVSTGTVTENNVSTVRITPSRAWHVNLRNQTGTEIGTSSNPVRIDPTGTTNQPVTQATSPWVTSRNWTLASGTDSVSAVQSGTWTTGRTWTLLNSTDSVNAVQSGTWTVQQGGTPTAVANAWPIKLTDGTSTTAVKAASTAALAADPSAVVALSPNSPLPTGSNNVGSITNITGTVSLPTGASTLVAQNTGNASLASIDAGIPSALGQTTMANSMPVVISSDQTKIGTKNTITTGGTFGTVTIGTTAVAIRVGGSNLTNRCSLIFMVKDSQGCTFGTANTVTTANGMPAFQSQLINISVDATVTYYGICAVAGRTFAVQEDPC